MSWDAVGDEVRKRRHSLGLTQVEVVARGGPSVETLSALERRRAGRLSRQSRRALERALEWGPGSIDAILVGGHPQPLRDADAAATDHAARMSLATRLIELKRTLSEQRAEMSDGALQAFETELNLATREVEEAIIKMLPWLSDEERGQAIRLLAELRQ